MKKIIRIDDHVTMRIFDDVMTMGPIKRILLDDKQLKRLFTGNDAPKHIYVIHPETGEMKPIDKNNYFFSVEDIFAGKKIKKSGTKSRFEKIIVPPIVEPTIVNPKTKPAPEPEPTVADVELEPKDPIVDIDKEEVNSTEEVVTIDDNDDVTVEAEEKVEPQAPVANTQNNQQNNNNRNNNYNNYKKHR